MFKEDDAAGAFLDAAFAGNEEPSRRLRDAFFDKFSLEIADTKEQKEWAYYLRFLAYCVENELQFPSGDYREADKYDHDDCNPQGQVIYHHQSTHVLLKANNSGRYVGTVRVIREGEYDLPAVEACPEPFLENFRRRASYYGAVAEISRFALPHKEMELAGINTQPNRDLALYGLMAGVFGVCDRGGIDVAIGAQERLLTLKIRRLGLDFDWKGKDFEYHGLRHPFVMSEPGVLRSLSKKPELYELFMAVRDKFDITLDECAQRGSPEIEALKRQALNYRALRKMAPG